MKAKLPKGIGGGPQNMQGMIKQAQKMQEEMETLQAELDANRDQTVAQLQRPAAEPERNPPAFN